MSNEKFITRYGKEERETEREPLTLKATKDLERACGHCMWWQPLNSVAGQCRRRAPHPYDDLSQGHYWPLTNRTVWCGDYTKYNDGKRKETQ